jgi:SAM-dependent methyltransferase
VADFDAITFWDVLEHLSDPLAALEKACSLLKPGGLLVISMPNPDGWERHLFKQFWAGWDMPRHLHLFPKSTIFQVLDSIGFQPIEASFFTGGYGMLVLSLEFLSSHPGSLVHRFPFILKFARTPLARLLAYPGYALLNFLQVTSSMTTFARKPLTEPD